MIEQIRNWEPKGTTSVTYKVGKEKRIWSAHQDQLLHIILGIIKEYQDANIRLSQRQLYYRLVAGGHIPNAMEIYKRICKLVTDARYGGYIDWDAIEDRGRSALMNPEWDSPQDLIESAIAQYRLPRWQDQAYHVELYVEKEAMESILQPIANKYHIRFGANKGYSSATMIYELAGRLKEKIKEGKECVVLYLGDHDSSGLDMVRDIKDRIHEFLRFGDEPVDEDVQIVHVALTTAQVKHYKPPPNPAKSTDSRYEEYLKKFGKYSWELDALEPKVLATLTEQAIHKYLDVPKYNAWIRKEADHKVKLRKETRKVE